MKKVFASLATLLIILTIHLSVASPVLAQSPSQATQLTTAPIDEELKTLREQYKTQLSIYRTDERAYTLAREQYGQLGTLASLEVAVRATQKVMQSRIDVLKTYFKILEVLLGVTPGIDVNEKETLLKDISAIQERLKQHQELVKLAVDRIQLDKAARDFQAISGDITRVSYKALSYRSYGKMQAVYDKTLAIRAEITAELEAQEKSGLRLGEKRRALEEIDRGFESTAAQLGQIRAGFLPVRNRKENFSSSQYDQTVQSLGSVYGDIYKVINYFREVEKS